MIKNEKGFALTEILILSAVVIGVLTFMFMQFKTINRSYQESFKYDTPEGMYLANNILNYINSDNYDLLVEQLLTEPKGYIDITNCDVNLYNKSTLCENLYRESGIEQIVFTKENPAKVKMNIRDFENDMQDFIKQIKTINSETDYRIIIKYTNGTFATMRFNKGNAYVQSGLIVYLDSINNTSEGHSNDTTKWKDLSGNGNDASLYNNPLWDNNLVTFDGESNYGRIESTTNMVFENGITLEARMKIVSTTGVNQDNLIALFGNWENAGGGIHYNNSTQKIESMLHIGTNKRITSGINTNLGEIHTVTVTYNNKTQALFIDGNIVATETYSTNAVLTSSAVPFAIGGNPTGSGMDYYANVEFYNILIYDRALSENEVMRNYQADTARY